MKFIHVDGWSKARKREKKKERGRVKSEEVE